MMELIDIQMNDVADKHAKIAVSEHRVPLRFRRGTEEHDKSPVCDIDCKLSTVRFFTPPASDEQMDRQREADKQTAASADSLSSRALFLSLSFSGW